MRREREREREEEPRKPRRARLRSSSPTASHPKTDRPRPRSSSPIASHPKADCPRPRSLSSIAISPSRRSRSQHQSASRDLACRRTQSRPDYEFFFLGVICVSGLRNEIIYLFGSGENLRKCEQDVENVFSMVFSTTQPNTRKYFSQYFFKYNQTLKNIF